jgi:ATP-dependent Clp protease adaptor protein ClpS
MADGRRLAAGGWRLTAEGHRLPAIGRGRACPIGRVAAAGGSPHPSAGIVIAMDVWMSDDKKAPPPTTRGETGLVLDERTRTRKPPMYKVLLHNDDYTTKEFVVFVLQSIFQRSEGDAIAIMNHVHANGVGIAGIYTFEIAETKVTKTVQLARSHEYPLQLSIEPTE